MVCSGVMSASPQRLRAQGGLGQSKQKMNHPSIRLYIFLANLSLFLFIVALSNYALNKLMQERSPDRNERVREQQQTDRRARGARRMTILQVFSAYVG